MASSNNKSDTTQKALQDNSKSRGASQQSQPKKNHSFERSYQGIINKQILEATCNEEEIKRQLHIFMPASAKSLLNEGGSKKDEESLEEDTSAKVAEEKRGDA